MTAAETFQAWATGAVAVTTAVAIVLGGAWALWRYVLPGPFSATWEFDVRPCSVRLLPSGRYAYMIEIHVKNMSNASYTIARVAGAVYPPEAIPEEEELARKGLTLPEAEVSLRCPPGTRRTLRGGTLEVDSLDHIVLAAWSIQYRGPRWLGIAMLGEREGTSYHSATVPVDAQSLGLYVNREEAASDD